MNNRFNNVELKCSATHDPENYSLKIDGHIIKGVRKVVVTHSCDAATIVEIEIIANVNIGVEAIIDASG